MGAEGLDMFEALLLAGEVATTEGWTVEAVAPGALLGRLDIAHRVVMAYHHPYPLMPFYLGSVDHWRRAKETVQRAMAAYSEEGGGDGR